MVCDIYLFHHNPVWAETSSFPTEVEQGISTLGIILSLICRCSCFLGLFTSTSTSESISLVHGKVSSLYRLDVKHFDPWMSGSHSAWNIVSEGDKIPGWDVQRWSLQNPQQQQVQGVGQFSLKWRGMFVVLWEPGMPMILARRSLFSAGALARNRSHQLGSCSSALGLEPRLM